MVRSMTGFGRGEASNERMKINVEMKSVNHRYLDLGIKLPRKLNLYEAAVRGVVKEFCQRGKVDVFVSYEEFADSSVTVTCNQGIASEYVEIARRLSEEFGIPNNLDVTSLMRMPEVVSTSQNTDEDDYMEGLLTEAVRNACQGFVATREKEGDALVRDLIGKLEYLLELTARVEERSPQVVAEYKQKLYDKVREVMADSTIDESRIMQEVTIFSDKICVDEETVRLKAHINNMIDLLRKGGAMGRKLDFVAQEMNREANTTLSKCNDLETSAIAIEMKTEIEKVREQIQNIE